MRQQRISDPYHIHFENNRLWENLTWLGVPMWKLPNDAMIIQEVIYETKPEIIIETGTGRGGSALFYASILQLIGKGEVLTIDIEYKRSSDYHNLFVNRRVTQIIGQSTHSSIIERARKFSSNKSTMVILDSFHSEEYVLEELNLYADFVSVGNYLIVEDTHVNGNPIEWKYKGGPMEAVKKFLKKDTRFEVDKSREKLILTFNPDGFLRRTK